MLNRIMKAQRLMDTACEKAGDRINIMEVCGTHTVSIFRNGIRPTLPDKLNSSMSCCGWRNATTVLSPPMAT